MIITSSKVGVRLAHTLVVFCLFFITSVASAQTWLPWPTRVCSGEPFTQITATGATRQNTGTKAAYCRCTQGFEPKRENVCRGTQFTASCKNSAWSHYTQVDFGSSLGTNWAPSKSTVCTGQTFQQTSSCGIKRNALGTKPVGGFTPATSTKACGVAFTQTRVCGSSRTARGTKPSSDWSPATNSVCVGQSFQQTRSCGAPRTVVGTKPASAFSPNTNTVACGVRFTQTRACGTGRQAVGTRASSDWSPRASSVCYGETFTQTRSCGAPRQTTGTKITGECHESNPDFDGDGILNVEDEYPLQSDTQCFS